VNKWQESGEEALGTDRTEVNTEMWCMWGVQDMRDDQGNIDFPNSFPSNLDGDFTKWDIFPSDLEPEEDPVVRPANSGVAMFSFGVSLLAVALLF